MKNLRKILVAIAVIAIMISSVVVLSATAEDTAYTGQLSEAQALLVAVPRDHVYNGRLALQKVYDYLKETPVDPNTAGYSDFCAELYSVALKILNEYHNKYLEGGEVTDFELIYSLIDTYGIPDDTPDPDGEETKYTTITEIKRSIETASLGYAKPIYESAKTAHGSGDIAKSTKTLRELYDHIESFPISSLVSEYADFLDSYNLLSLEISEGIAAELNSYRDNANADGADDAAKQSYKERLATLLTIVRDHNKDCPVDVAALPKYEERYNAYVDAMIQFDFDQISFLFEDYEAKDFDAKDDAGNYIYDFPELARASELSKVSAALKSSSVPETFEGYAELVEKIKAEEVEVAAAKEARRQALSDATPLEQFELTNNIITNDYNDKNVKSYINQYHTSSENNNQYKYHDTDNPTDMYWNYYSLGSPNTSAYTEIYVRNKTNSNAIGRGFVMSFDYMVENTNPNGGHFSKATFSLRFKKNDTGSIKLDDGSNVAFGTTLFTIEYDANTGALKVYNTVQPNIPVATTRYNVAAEGQWFNLMVTYDPVTRFGKLYIDYQEMFEIYYQVKPGKDELPDNAGVGEFRVSQSPAAWNNMNFDNFMKYEGTAYRDLYKFDGMKDPDLFIYYVDFLTGDVASLENKFICYNRAKALLEFMKKEYEGLEEEDMTDALKALRDRVEKFEKYDKENYESVFLPAIIEEKTQQYADKVALLTALTVDSTTVDKLNKEIALLDEFVSEFNDFIDKADSRYTQGVAKVSAIRQKVAGCENAVKFARMFVQFNRATTVASMQKRANSLAEIYKLARYDKAENRALVENDSAIRSFEAQINNGLSPEDEGYITIFDYYLNYVSEIIKAQQKVENSVRIVKCIELLCQLEGYEDTEEFWKENRDEVEFYISIIRDIVSANNYDPSNKEVDEAILHYELVDAYLYVLIQDDHVEAITAQLDKFAASESYIEKRGICTYVAKYFAENTNINHSLPEIQDLKNRLEIYELELSAFSKDFEGILKRNTQYFIDTVKKFEGLTTYAELKPVYDTALSYYYVMNVTDSDEDFNKAIEEAIEVFDACDKRLADIEVNTELFIKTIIDIDIVEGMGLRYEYQALSDAAPYYEYLDMTYVEMKYAVPEAEEPEADEPADDTAPEDTAKEDGIDSEEKSEEEKLKEELEAKRRNYERTIKVIGIYERMYKSYNEAIDSVNAASAEAADLSVAFSADSVPVAILAIINQISKR